MIVEPILPVIANLVAIVLPVLANLIAAVLPILSDLAPVTGRELFGPALPDEPIVKGLSPLLNRPVGGQLADPRSAISKAGQRGGSISYAVPKPRTDACTAYWKRRGSPRPTPDTYARAAAYVWAGGRQG
jgi:hypothetical protein